MKHIEKIIDDKIKKSVPTELCLFDMDIHEYITILGKIFYNENEYKIIVNNLAYSEKWFDDESKDNLNQTLYAEAKSIMKKFRAVMEEMKTYTDYSDDGLYLAIIETKNIPTSEMIKEAYFKQIEIMSNPIE
jgi:hypothetical protein